jgi:ATP-binding cassette, subfamily F, member 3
VRCARNKATTEVGNLSGGERARLALALITRDAPHLLILDEPTNHLDVDAREALVQALNGFDGAVLIVSHDRHMLELTADRLVLVDGGTAREFDGSMDDYVAFILGKSAANDDAKGATAKPKDAKAARQEAAKAREAQAALRKSAKELEAKAGKLAQQISAIDRAMFDPAGAEPALAKLTMGDLAQRRGKLAAELEAAEAAWMDALEAIETAAA